MQSVCQSCFPSVSPVSVVTKITKLSFMLVSIYGYGNAEVIAINASKGLKSVALLLNNFSQSRNFNRQLGFSLVY